MLGLKDYQQRVLNSLQSYFKKCSDMDDADRAFYETTRESFGTPISYNPIAEFPRLPYICLRIPTGGGKTLVATHAIGIANNELLHTEHSVVLWLVPSNAIREQTLKAFRNPAHHYRQALESLLGSVTVLDVSEALSVPRGILDTTTTIIVSTIQAFRVEETEGRKVYSTSGSLMEHFSGVPSEKLNTLEKNEENIYKKSLANVLRLRRPIVIVDEAHNARTSLSFDMLARFDPSCIIEFTATPDTENNPSNVLHSVSAAELKAEQMIKLPIKLQTKDNWKELLADAIKLREDLEEIAIKKERAQTEEYIRPIMLIQAQSRKNKNNITFEVVEECLINDHNIPKNQIAVETGERRDLNDIADISSPTCEVRFVITVQALREGWDCPFAYVLCSLAEMKSNTAIEQLLGRVMRLPKAKFKVNKQLNAAYAFATSDFFTAVDTLKEALIQNGFNRQEADDYIKKGKSHTEEEPLDGQLDLFGEQWDKYSYEPITISVTEVPDTSILSDNIAEKVEINKLLSFTGVMNEEERDELQSCFNTSEGKKVIDQIYNKSIQEQETQNSTIITVNINDIPNTEALSTNLAQKFSVNNAITLKEKINEEELEEIKNCFSTVEAKETIDQEYKQKTHILEKSKPKSPAERGEPFNIPALAIKQGDIFEMFEETHFLDAPWNLTDYDAFLSEKEFSYERPQGQVGEISVSDKGEIKSRFLSNLQEQMSMFNTNSNWTIGELVMWLDRNIPHPDISPSDSSQFLLQLVRRLINERGFRLDQIVLNKYRLRDQLDKKIKEYRNTAKNSNYQLLLFNDFEESVSVTPEISFSFNPEQYPFSTPYSGDHDFSKHYYPQIGDLLEKGEEFRCAQFIDSLDEVNYWVRNIARRPKHSFWLQTSTDKFYPDFVCLLSDGRYLVVEYKGEDRWSDDDSKEKRDIGQLWETRSNGTCLFIMPKGNDLQAIRAKIRE